MISTFELSKRITRPVLILKNIGLNNKDGKMYPALLDTGADFPVWTKSEELLRALGGKLVNNDVKFTGFGRKVRA